MMIETLPSGFSSTWNARRLPLDPCMRRRMHGPIQSLYPPTFWERLLGKV